MKMIMPTLTAEAVKALARATLGGPNCSHEIGVRELLEARKEYSLAELGRYFQTGLGPDTFLASYAVLRNQYQLKAQDIAQAYCVDHLPMVRAAGEIFKTQGASDPYFESLRIRGFKLSGENLQLYLFCCLGKLGRVDEIIKKGEIVSRAKVEVWFGPYTVVLNNVVIPATVKPRRYIAIHFASGFTTISIDRNVSEILQQQQQSGASSVIKPRPPSKIDFTNIFGQDLTEWTEQQLTPDQD